MVNKIITQRDCNKCDHGVLPYMNKMGYEDCDCHFGAVFTEYELSEEQLVAIERVIVSVVSEKEK